MAALSAKPWNGIGFPFRVSCMGACSVDLHTQSTDKAEQTEEERLRSQELLSAAKAAVDPSASSNYAKLAQMCPFLVVPLRWMARNFPDSHIVRSLPVALVFPLVSSSRDFACTRR